MLKSAILNFGENMQILSHRGYWKNENEKNSFQAFKNSFSKMHGLETDIRDWGGGL